MCLEVQRSLCLVLKVLNLMECYVQSSIDEGQGFELLERVLVAFHQEDIAGRACDLASRCACALAERSASSAGCRNMQCCGSSSTCEQTQSFSLCVSSRFTLTRSTRSERESVGTNFESRRLIQCISNAF